MIPPRPNWKCLNPKCNHVLYLKPHEEAPKKCPRCGGEKILNLHLQKMSLSTKGDAV